MYNVALPDHPSLPPYVRLVPILSSLKINAELARDNILDRDSVPWADPNENSNMPRPLKHTSINI